MEMTVANPVSQMNPTHPSPTHLPHEDRKHTAQRIANEMFHQQPDWITTFYRFWEACFRDGQPTTRAVPLSSPEVAPVIR